MSKIKRNDPCPCGSGKKYKRCHGATTNNIDSNQVNNELARFHHELLIFAQSKYKNNIDNLIKKFKEFFDNDEATNMIYFQGLTMWIILSLPFIDNRTIFDTFFKQTKNRYSLQTRNLLEKWGESVPSIYEVKSIDKQKSKQIKVKDISSNVIHTIPYHKNYDVAEGSFILGIIVPFQDHSNFFYTIIKLYRHNRSDLVQLLDKHATKQGGIKIEFPQLLAETLMAGFDENKQVNSLYEQVAQLFAKHMTEKNYSDKVILDGIKLWDYYCETEKPAFKNVASYAAALDYFMEKVVLDNQTITQSGVAEQYDVSSGTVSVNYRKLLKVLEIQVANLI